MIFGWRDRREPQPELVPKAKQRYERALKHLEDGHDEAAQTELEKAAELGQEAATDEGFETAAQAHERLAALHEAAGLSGARRQALEAAAETGAEAGTPEGHLVASRTCYEMGVRHLEEERPEEARRTLELAMAHGEDSQRPQGKVAAARAQRVLGLLASEHGSPDQAIDHLSQALDLATGTGEVEGLETGAHAGLDLGLVLWDHGDLEDARQALEQAVALGEQVASASGFSLAAEASRLMGELAAERGLHEDALQAIQDAQALGEQAGTPEGELQAARAAWSMANVHRDQGAGDQALTWYGQATAIVAEIGTPEAEAVFAEVQLDRGELLEHQDRLREASDVYAAAALRGADSQLTAGIDAAHEARSRNMELDLPPPDPEQPPTQVVVPRTTTSGTGQPTDTGTPETQADDTPDDPAPTHQAPEEPTSRIQDTDGDRRTDQPSPTDTGSRQTTPPPGATEPRTNAREPQGAVQDLWQVLDRADTVLEVAPQRRDEAGIEATIATLDEALEHWGPDARLIERRARCQDLLGRWRGTPTPLRQAIEDYGHAFELKGGRVDPRTHDPGPSFFFAWGRALYDLASLEQDPDLFEEARDRLTTGYEMTPRGADHSLASAVLARLAFHLAQAGREPEGYARAIELYTELEADGAGFALEAEDHAIWAKALAHRADQADDPSFHREAYQRMAKAYEAR